VRGSLFSLQLYMPTGAICSLSLSAAENITSAGIRRSHSSLSNSDGRRNESGNKQQQTSDIAVVCHG